jgi:hypothetical protein
MRKEQPGRQCAYNIEARSRKHCCHAKAIRITYSECVSVALVIQHIMRMRRILLSDLTYLAVPCFSRLSHKRRDFRNTKLLNVKSLFRFSRIFTSEGARGGVVVKALRYKPAGRGFDSRWRHWNFSVT